MSFRNCLYVFLISMVPIIELRGGIPIGVGLGMPWYVNYLLCVAGNLLPVPFILLFIRALLRAMHNSKVGFFRKIALFVEEKAQKHTDRVMKYTSLGLFLFVAIPLPGTGAWTGALVAATLDMRMRYALPSIIAGVLCAGAIMTGISYGVLGFLSWLA